MSDTPKGSRPAEIVVIGAGPSGLTAALELQRGGRAPLLLERAGQVGGLMRSLRLGGAVLDLGRKELYARFPEVDALWTEVLGDDFAEYPHRVGSLYRGRIVEMSGRYRGPARGMPLPWLLRGGAGLLRGWAGGALRPPRTMADYWSSRVGAEFARILARGYWEKFRGTTWDAMPAPAHHPTGARPGPRVLAGARQALGMARRGGVAAQAAWRHPRGGTGQLFERIAGAYAAGGGRLVLGAEVTALTRRPGGRVRVAWTADGQGHETDARQVISSLPVERLWALLSPDAAPGDAPSPGPEAGRAVLLVYLLFDAPPPFPHAWLEVNDPNLRCGRITNYAAFGGGMVPDGQTALCVEYFCAGDDPLLARDASGQIAFALSELRGAGLTGAAPIACKAVTLPRTNAAASWREQQSAHRAALFERLRAVPEVYHVNRPGSDWASLAGLQAARAILSGDRAAFDAVADPTRRQEEPAT